MKFEVEINKISNRKTKTKINKIQIWFLEKINIVDKHLASLDQEKSKKTQITKIKNKKGNITISLTETKRIIR